MNTQETVLVSGATGQQGGAAARAFLRSGLRVRALTRNPGSAAARELERLGAEVCPGDLEDRTTVMRAAQGADAVFAVTTPFEAGTDAEVRQGITLAQAAKDAGIGHIVYSSVASADRQTGIPHFESKYAVERFISDLCVPFTVIAPTGFFENLVGPWSLPGLQQGVLAAPLPSARAVQQIAVADIGAFAAFVLRHRDRFVNKRIDIASDAVTGAEQAEVLSAVTGGAIRYVELPLDQVRASGGEDMAMMFEWLNRVGYSADVEGLRRDYPEVGWHRFGEWARNQDWSVLRAA